jgi:hypothetical protein
MKCVYCGKGEARKKYCSVACVKRAYILRKRPNIKAYSTGNKLFWETETGIGFKWEQYAAKILGAKHIPFNHGPDLYLGDMGIDVKVCNLYKRKNKRGKTVEKENQNGWWIFNKNSEKESVKVFFCICLDGSKIVKRLYIPAEEFKGKGITVGHKSRFDQFIYTS